MEEEVRVVLSVQCDSLSGKSKLNYEFGLLTGKGVQFRIVSNSGGGMFWKDWISMEEVITVLASPEVSEAISATAFKIIFAGRSINTQSFLMAALRNEGAIRPHSTRPRGYEVVEVEKFRARIQALIEVPPESTGEAAEKPAIPVKRAILKLKQPKV